MAAYNCSARQQVICKEHLTRCYLAMLRILIADDHAAVRQSLKDILLEEFVSSHVDEADDTDTLLEKIADGNWDIIVSDLDMPGGGGMAMLKHIRSGKNSTPVIIVSMFPADQYEQRVIDAGANAFLGKDFIATKLCPLIREITGSVK
jgi:two-component system invasion response regulator UvrY